MKTEIENLPTWIRSIKKPTWTDMLHWTENHGIAMADIDHDWRIWVSLSDGECQVRHKGGQVGPAQFGNLADGLAYLDYEEIR